MLNKLWILSAGVAVLASCADLDTYPEGSLITSDQKVDVVGKIPTRLSADISGMYSLMSKNNGVYPKDERDDDFGYPSVCISADANGPDFVTTNDNYNWYTICNAFEDRTYTYANPYIRWALFYNQIKMANDILLSIPDSTDKETLLQYKGQALAVRAFDYLNLVQRYQFTYLGNEDKPAVPLVTTVPLADESSIPRATVTAIYEQILSDLDQAIPLLDGFERTDKGFINQNVAYGLRARAHLLMGNYAEAAVDATTAMAGFSFLSKADVSVPSFNNASATSWMWALVITPVNITSTYGNWPSKLCSFAGNSYTCNVGCYKMISNLLWDKIPTTDVRKGWWVDTDLKSPLIDGQSWPGYTGEAIGPLVIKDIKMAFLPYTNVKFAAYNNEMGNGENASDWCMMRAEEMLFIQAEGLAMSGHLPEAITALEDFVKNYRDPSYTCSATTPAEMQTEIWKQRRIELWGEGFAFEDAMRLKKNIVRFHSGDTGTNWPSAFKFNMSSTDPWLLMRIPQKEINSNAGIPEEANNTGGVLPQSGDGASLEDGVTD